MTTTIIITFFHVSNYYARCNVDVPQSNTTIIWTHVFEGYVIQILNKQKMPLLFLTRPKKYKQQIPKNAPYNVLSKPTQIA
jgi:hypothetical protein